MSMELTPSERLALSRERLRQALRATATRESAHGRAGGGTAATASWGDRLRSVPGAALARLALGRWWARQPWRGIGEVLLDSATLVLRPVARRSPLGLMLGALALGGLLARLRPWRWIPKFVLMAGLLPQLLPRGVAAEAGLSWSGLLLSLLRQARRPPD